MDKMANREPRPHYPPKELLGILLDNEFTVESIRQAMGQHFPENLKLLGADAARIDYKRIANIAIDGSNRFESDKLQLYTIPDFLTDGECDKLVELSSISLRPSTISTGDRNQGYRTSTRFFSIDHTIQPQKGMAVV